MFLTYEYRLCLQNADCQVNVPDVLILLSQFGDCSVPATQRMADYAHSELYLSVSTQAPHHSLMIPWTRD